MPDKIPISFTWQEHNYKGYFSQAHGAGGQLWQLYITDPPGKKPGDYFFGQLFTTGNFGWQFHGNKGAFQDMTEFFAEVVTAWYE